MARSHDSGFYRRFLKHSIHFPKGLPGALIFQLFTQLWPAGHQPEDHCIQRRPGLLLLRLPLKFRAADSILELLDLMVRPRLLSFQIANCPS